MSQSPEKFAQFLTEGIHQIRLNEDKAISIVQDELGYALGRKGGSAVERWRKGYLPPKAEDVELLAQILIQRGRFDRAWTEAFLESAGYPQSQALCDQLFTPLVTSSLPQEEVATLTAVPPLRRVSPGLMASISLVLVGAVVWLWLQAGMATSAVSPIPVLAEDAYGVLLVTTADPTLAAIWQSDLQAQLAASGLTEQVVVRTYPAESTASLAYLQHVSRAQLVVRLPVRQEGEGIVASWQFVGQRPSPALNAIMAALSEPVTTTSATAVSNVSASRLTAIINADLGYMALHAGQYEACARRFTAVLAQTEELQASFTRAEASHVALAVCLDALGQAEAARTHFEEAIVINPDFAQGHFGLGNYWYSQYNLVQARGYYEQTAVLAAIDPLASAEVTSRAYAGLGNIALVEKRLTDALAAFSQAIAYDGTNPAYFLGRAMAYEQSGDLPLAVADLQSCLELARTVEADPSAYLQQVAADCQAALAAVQATHTPMPTAKVTSTATTTAMPTETATATPSPIGTPTLAITWVPLSTILSTPTTTVTTAVRASIDAPTPTPLPPMPTLRPPTTMPPSATPLPTASATWVVTLLPTERPPLATVTLPNPVATATASLPPTFPPTSVPSATPTSPIIGLTEIPTTTPPPTIPSTETPTIGLPPTFPPTSVPSATPLPPTVPPTGTPIATMLPPTTPPTGTPTLMAK